MTTNFEREVQHNCRRELSRLLPGNLGPSDLWLKSQTLEDQLALLAWAERVPSNGEAPFHNYIPRAPQVMFRWVEQLKVEQARSGVSVKMPDLYLEGYDPDPEQKNLSSYEKRALEAMHERLDEWFKRARKCVSDDLPESTIKFGLSAQGYEDEPPHGNGERIIGAWVDETVVDAL
jgi:hypothetical protein